MLSAGLVLRSLDGASGGLDKLRAAGLEVAIVVDDVCSLVASKPMFVDSEAGGGHRPARVVMSAAKAPPKQSRDEDEDEESLVPRFAFDLSASDATGVQLKHGE